MNELCVLVIKPNFQERRYDLLRIFWPEEEGVASSTRYTRAQLCREDYLAGVAIAGVRVLPILELPEFGVAKVLKEDPVVD